MAQYFYINQNSELPALRMELINDGQYDFEKSEKFNEAIQNADIYFTMVDETGVLKISNAKCEPPIFSQESGCEGKYIIEYKWKKRDTKKKGMYKGSFTIEFKDDTVSPEGTLIVPIYEDLIIQIK